MDMGSNPISSTSCIRGRVVEGAGLIIRFPLGTSLVQIQSDAHTKLRVEYCFFFNLIVRLIIHKKLYQVNLHLCQNYMITKLSVKLKNNF